MKKLRVALATLLATTALVSVPAFAADNAATMSREIQMLQDQLRALQQQLDSLKASETAGQAAIAKEAADRQAAIAAEQQKVDAAAAAAAAVSAPPKTAHVAESGAHKFSMESADGQYSIAVTGRLNLDLGDYVNFTPATSLTGTQHLSSGFNARRARIGVTGKLAGDWIYTFVYDGGNSADNTAGGIQTAQVSYAGFKNVLIDLPGYSDTAFTFEEAQSSNDLMFMERASPVNVATSMGAGDFRSNTGIRYMDDRFWLGAYLTGPKGSSDAHTNLNERFGAFERATVQVVTGPDYSLHIGGEAFELLQAPNTGVGTAVQVTLNDSGPELRIDSTALLTTGALGSVTNPVNGGTVYGAEAAGGFQSLYFQSEFYHYNVHRFGMPANNFEGAYAAVSYTLTGEHRAYNRTTGAYGSITPSSPFTLDGGTGAWEIAARYSYVNMRDFATPGQTLPGYGVNGGLQENTTVGVNWYTNTWLRFMLNWVHSDLHKFNTSTSIAALPLGAQIGDKMDAIAGRVQLSW